MSFHIEKNIAELNKYTIEEEIYRWLLLHGFDKAIRLVHV